MSPAHVPRPDPPMPAIGGIRIALTGISLLFAAGFLAVPVTAQPKPLESQVKAAFIPKFAAYVNWPSNALGQANEPIQLCLIGRDPFGAALDQAVSGQHVDSHALLVRRLDSTANAAACHIAFLSGSSKQTIAAMQDSLRGKPILTVTDSSLGDQRGMVHFVLKDGRVRFYIDDAMAARSDLTISARLLSLAIGVKQRAPA